MNPGPHARSVPRSAPGVDGARLARAGIVVDGRFCLRVAGRCGLQSVRATAWPVPHLSPLSAASLDGWGVGASVDYRQVDRVGGQVDKAAITVLRPHGQIMSAPEIVSECYSFCGHTHCKMKTSVRWTYKNYTPDLTPGTGSVDRQYKSDMC